MTAVPPAPDSEAEREVDLIALGRGLLRLWWIVVLGVVGGAIVGALFSLSGASTYEATARIAPGQAFNPGGSTAVLTYLSNRTAVNEIATSEATLDEAAAKLGIPVTQLRGRVSTAAVIEGGGSTGHAVLIDITAQLKKKKLAEDAANEIARIVQRATTSKYVRQSLTIYGTRINSFNTRLRTLQDRIDVLDKALRQPGLTLNERLLLTIQLDQAQATQGQTIDSLSTAQQQQILAQTVEQTQIIQDAKAEKTQARSRQTSVVVGAIIGLLVGLLAALVVYFRGNRVRTA
jgi:uncharacterized protein involved in exopolysaccharide biosynthesis